MNVIDKIADLLNLSKVEVSLEQLPLEDGTVLEAEKFEAGFSVGVVTPDGVIPVPVGEHKLQDGRTLVVMTEGVIEEVLEPMQEEPEAVEEQPVEASTEQPVAKEPKRVVESVSKETFFQAIQEIEKHFEAKLSALKIELSKDEEKPVGIKPQTPVVEKQEKHYKGIEEQFKKIINA